jgi:hypothetical protein
MDDRAEEPIRSNNPEELQGITMSNKKIESWKVQVARGKTIFVASNVKIIHPVVDSSVTNLSKIDLINYVTQSGELPDSARFRETNPNPVFVSPEKPVFPQKNLLYRQG